MNSTLLIFFLAVCALLIIAKLLKVEKLAAVLGLGVIILWLALHFTGYDKTINHIIFEAPPVQPARPEDLRNR